MSYPNLVNPAFCKIDVKITFYSNDLSEDGEPLDDVIINTKCNYQNSTRGVSNSEKQTLEVGGKLLLPGDITPGINVYSGKVKIFGEEHEISKIQKWRNPDGTVNYTEIEVR